MLQEQSVWRPKLGNYTIATGCGDLIGINNILSLEHRRNFFLGKKYRNVLILKEKQECDLTPGSS